VDSEKYFVKALSSYLRDKMATAVYHLMARHSETVRRCDYGDMAKECVAAYVEETFTKLKWQHDVFDAEYITKKTKADREYEEVVRTLSRILKAYDESAERRRKRVSQKKNSRSCNKVLTMTCTKSRMDTRRCGNEKININQYKSKRRGIGQIQAGRPAGVVCILQ